MACMVRLPYLKEGSTPTHSILSLTARFVNSQSSKGALACRAVVQGMKRVPDKGRLDLEETRTWVVAALIQKVISLSLIRHMVLVMKAGSPRAWYARKCSKAGVARVVGAFERISFTFEGMNQ